MLITRRSVLVFAGFGALLLADSARASQDLRGAMADLAKAILDKTKNQPITVGPFSPTDLPDSNAGVGFEQILTAELEALSRGVVRADAPFTVKGDYQLVKPRPKRGALPERSLREIRVTARIIDKETGEERKELRVEAPFDSTKDILKTVQATAALPPQGNKEERHRELERRLKEPSVFIHGPNHTLISSTADSPYAVELLVKPLENHEKHTAQPRPAREERGLAFVDIQQKELYEVKVYNNSDREVAVSLTIDGLDVFHFSKDRNDRGEPRFTHFIVAPTGTVTIVGWHNTIDPAAKDNFLSFLVTGYGQGAVSKAGIPSRGQVGVLHVQFSDCRPLPEGSKARSGNETGFGPPREVKQKAVRYEIEPPHDAVSVRYTR
jgi:hypothetical protein